MFWDAFKITVRHLWRQKLFTALNILGLAIGISACWVIYSIVGYEFSFEKDFPNKEKTYRLVSKYDFDGKESYNGGVSKPLYQAIREQVLGIDRVVPVFSVHNLSTVEAEQQGPTKSVVEDPQRVIATDSSYFKMTPYDWLAGSANHALSSPNQVVLTESRARSYFGSLAPRELIGKTLIYNDTLQKTVSGIVKDLPYNTEFDGQEFFAIVSEVYPLGSWTSTNGADKVYLQIANSATADHVLEQISALTLQKWKEFERESDQGLTNNRQLELLPLGESHFSTHINEYPARKANKRVLYGLIGTGIFLLLLACINYVNMTTAQIPQRKKEIGVRKTLGESRASLIRQLLRETLLITCIASIFAFLMTKLAFSLISDSIPEGSVNHLDTIRIFMFLIILVLVITFSAGSYPAWLVARLNPVRIMRGGEVLPTGNVRISLRKGLIVFQFVIAELFIVCALISGAQLSYSLKSDMGFDKEAVVLVSVPREIHRDEAYDGKLATLVAELKREPAISMVSMGTAPMIDGYSSSGFEYGDGEAKAPVQRQVSMKWVDTAYMHLYDLDLLAGRNLHPSDTINEYVINETALKAFSIGSPRDAIGKMIGQRGNKFPIVGVVKDFHVQNFYADIEPVALQSTKSHSTLNIKLDTQDPEHWQETLKRVEQNWNSIYPPGTFEYKFYDESIAAMYKQERSLSKLINLATAIAITISCLGLFGLATLTAYQRVKEIGIRKVLGSSVLGIVQLLSKDFVKLVCIAILIASPIAWWAMTKWLEDFAYRIEIQWWMFALAGILAIAIALSTISFQAIRAALANPVDSLRDE